MSYKLPLQFEVVFRYRGLVVARVINDNHRFIDDEESLTTKISETEKFLEKLTGLRVQINKVNG